MSNIRQKPKTKKQLIAEALEASLEAKWDVAIQLNDELLNRFPRDAEALNRKGRAYIELNDLSAARDAYTEALKADPANMIARRNLQRLETLYARKDGFAGSDGAANRSIPAASVFIEEIGKTWFDELAHAADPGVLAEVAPGDEVTLAVEGGRVIVSSMSGVMLGEIELHIGSRLAKALDSDHKFEAYALGMTTNSLRIVIREISRPEGSEMIVFPRQDFASQDLLRENQQLSQREEGDFDFGGDEDEDADLVEEEAEEEDEEDEEIEIEEPPVMDDDEEEAPE